LGNTSKGIEIAIALGEYTYFPGGAARIGCRYRLVLLKFDKVCNSDRNCQLSQIPAIIGDTLCRKYQQNKQNKLDNSRNNYRKLNFWGGKREKQFAKRPK
jgi:hypothetical protein